MIRFFILFYFLINFLYSYDYYFKYSSEYVVFLVGNPTPIGQTYLDNSYSISGSYYYPFSHFPYTNETSVIINYNGYEYPGTKYDLVYNFDYSCLNNNIPSAKLKVAKINDFRVLDFCYIPYHSGYVYSSVKNIWVSENGNGDVICSPTTFNINNQCKDICPAGNIYFNYNGQNYCVLPDINDLSNILGDKIKDCSFVTIDGKLKIISENGKDYTGLRCGSSLYLLPYASNDLQIGSDTNISSPQDQNITCDSDENIVINDDGSIQCVPNTDNNSSDGNSDNSNDTGDTNTSSGSGHSDNSNDTGDTNTSSGSGSSDNNSTTSKDCCYYYTNPIVGDQWVQSNNEWCSDKYKCCITKNNDGKCINVTSSTTDGNSSSIDLTGVEDRIDTTNKLLKDIYNLQPDNNNSTDIDNLYNNTNSALSNINTFIDNYKSTFENLKDTFNKAVDLVKNPKTISFQSSITSCPLTINIYNNSITADICKFVSPYKPIIQLFFTFIFSLSVIFYFFDVFMRSKEG